MHLDSSFALMALELYGFNENFDRADSEDGSSQTYELIYQVRLDHGEREHLVEVRKTYLKHSLISKSS